MAQDRNGNNHKAAGRSDGGQFDKKAGQGSDDDLEAVSSDSVFVKGVRQRVAQYGGYTTEGDEELLSDEGLASYSPKAIEMFDALINDEMAGFDGDGVDPDAAAAWRRSMHRVTLRSLDGDDGRLAGWLRRELEDRMQAEDIPMDGPEADADDRLAAKAGLDTWAPEPLDMADALVDNGMDGLEGDGYDEDTRFAWARSMYREMI